ncbi:ROK family protein [Mesoplasma coleopterae]|uniref:ROK family protein n=1 Tax=Mesoplasma coleopterae TaxID=324078 RepID=UPI000D03B58A|nr:ROK family protein [Mesoplasma coleopterae]AVN62745.1 hypothetical protein CG000_00235 [Mesoplasma coleopterae]
MLNYTFDIGGTGVKCIIFENEKILESRQINFINFKEDTKFERQTLTSVLDRISLILDENKNEFNLAISIPGVVDSKNKKVLTESAIKEVDIDLVDYFSKYKNLKNFVVMNDAKAAAYGEFKKRTRDGENISNMIHLTIGSGLGSGIIIDGKILEGRKFKAGEAGKMFSTLQGEEIRSVTQDVGFGTLLMTYIKTTGNRIDGKELFKLYEQKDSIVLEMINSFIVRVAKFVFNLNFVFDFDLITIGGGISANPNFEKLLIEKINNFMFEFKKYNFVAENDDIQNTIKISHLKNQAACFGGLEKLREIK